MASQGEKLMLLVWRSDKEQKEIAKALGYTPVYLSRLFKDENIPFKVKAKAIEYFGVSKSYFENRTFDYSEIKNLPSEEIQEMLTNVPEEEMLKYAEQFYEEASKKYDLLKEYKERVNSLENDKVKLEEEKQWLKDMLDKVMEKR